MVRKGTGSFKNEQSTRVCKTPRVVLEKLNIPLDGVVLVRGDSIIYPLDNSAKKSDVIDITLSEDESEDVDFQEKMIKRFQSTKDNSSYNSKAHSSPKTFEPSNNDRLSPYREASSSTRNVKHAPKSQKEIFSQRKVTKKKSMHKSNNSGKIKKYDKPNKQSLMIQAGKRLSNFEIAEKHIEMQIESAGFLNVSSCTEDLDTSKKSLSGDYSSPGDTVPKSPTTISDGKHDSNENVLQKNDEHSKKDPCLLNPNPSTTVITKMVDGNSLSQDFKGSCNKTSDEQQMNATENKSDATPSRISQRIKNKKVKFSALDLLAGGDIYTLRKELLSENLKKPLPQKKSVNKTKSSYTAGVCANYSSISATNAKESSFVIISPTKEITTCLTTSVGSKSLNNHESNDVNKHRNISSIKTVNTLSSKRKQNLNLEKIKDYSLEESIEKSNDRNNASSKQDVEAEIPQSTSGINNVEPAEKALNETTAIVQKRPSMEEQSNIKKLSNKVRLELKGVPQKKVVNIAVSPSKESLKTQETRKDKNLKQKLNAELGPDIIIRRVKKHVNEHKTLEIEAESAAPTSKIQDTRTQNVTNKSNGMAGNIVVKNLIYAEKPVSSGLQPVKEVEVPPQIQKLLLEATKNKKTITFKPSETLMTKINSLASNKTINHFVKKRKKADKRKIGSKRTVANPKLVPKGKSEVLKSRGLNNEVTSTKDGESEDGNTSGRDMLPDVDSNETQLSDVQSANKSLEDSLTGINGLNEMMDKDAKKSASPGKDMKIGENKKNSKDDELVSSDVFKVGGKKTAKVTPLTQVSKVQTKISNEKELPRIPKSKTVPKLSSPSELCLLGGKRNYRNAFEKYFICTEKIYEHNDSVDSDSGSEDTLLLSHFIDLKRKGRENKEIDAGDKDCIIEGDTGITSRIENSIEETVAANVPRINPDSRTSEEKVSNLIDGHEKSGINEVIKGITADLPKWNWHVLPESSVVCLILLEREESGTLDVKKCIEIDCNFKANVYVNKELVNEYCGVYDSLEAIKNLIYQVDLL